MKLHRVHGKPDWADVEPADYNMWQNLAVRSNSIITPANVITMFGFFLVLYGLYEMLMHHYATGLISFVIGRSCDVLDGWAAETTGTKSPLGEALDAGFDKLATLFTVIGLLIGHIGPWWLLTALLLPHLIITAIVYIGRRRGIAFHPARSGKLSMAGAWFCFAGLLLSRMTHGSTSQAITDIVYVVAVLAIPLGMHAALSYASQKTGPS